MKTLSLIFCCASLSLAKTCEKGWTKTPEGVCQEGVVVDQSKWVSDETPPKDKMPSYQREGIHVVDAPSMVAGDMRQDEEAKVANAKGMAACEKKYGKGQCGERGKEPK